jgi:serine kinase of HPr protein (carbohydrate metabolism regulator)
MLLLLGSPGAGKTILTLALLKRGFRYGSDDVSLVKQHGEVEGLPMPLGVKESAWPIVEEVSTLPVHVRPDGQRVRFLPLTIDAVADAAPVGTVVRLKRTAEQSPELERISAQQGLAELFRESLSGDGNCSTEIMRALTEIVRNADCFELRYSDADAAASLVFEQIAR